MDSTCAAVGVPRLIRDGVGDPGKEARFFGVVDHRRRGAGGEQDIGDEVRRDGVGERLDERTPRPERGVRGHDVVNGGSMGGVGCERHGVPTLEAAKRTQRSQL